MRFDPYKPISKTAKLNERKRKLKYLQSKAVTHENPTFTGIPEDVLESLYVFTQNRKEKRNISSAVRDPKNPRYENFKLGKHSTGRAVDISLPKKFKSKLTEAFREGKSGKYKGNKYREFVKEIAKTLKQAKESGFQDLLIEEDHFHFGKDKTNFSSDLRFLSKDYPRKNAKEEKKYNELIKDLKLEMNKPTSKPAKKVEVKEVVEIIRKPASVKKKEIKVNSTTILESIIKDRKVPKKKEEFKGSFYDRKVLEAKARNVSRNEKKRLNEENVRKLSELGELGIRN